jgi:hypothetical protein
LKSRRTKTPLPNCPLDLTSMPSDFIYFSLA